MIIANIDVTVFLISLIVIFDAQWVERHIEWTWLQKKRAFIHMKALSELGPLVQFL